MGMDNYETRSSRVQQRGIASLCSGCDASECDLGSRSEKVVVLVSGLLIY